MYRLSANGMRSGGSAGFGGCCVHGGMGSDESSTQTNQVFNQQVTQSVGTSGRAVGISGSTIAGDVTVVDASPEVVNKALEAMSTSVNANLLTSLSSLALSNQNVNQALQVMQANGARALETADRAVEAAQGTALRATPIPPTNLSENISKQILVAAVAVVVVVAFRKK